MGRRDYQSNLLSSFLREERRRHGFSTIDVETLTENMPREYRISRGFVSQIENGATPSPYKLISLARIYKIKITDIFRAIGGEPSEICHCEAGLEEIRHPIPKVQEGFVKLKQLFDANFQPGYESVIRTIDDWLIASAQLPAREGLVDKDRSLVNRSVVSLRKRSRLPEMTDTEIEVVEKVLKVLRSTNPKDAKTLTANIEAIHEGLKKEDQSKEPKLKNKKS